MVRSGVLKLALTGAVLSIVFACGAVLARESIGSTTDATVAVNRLPPQGLATYQLIRRGGPFPYEKDGVVFANRERLLPAHTRGYYHEYTVQTPASRGRGTRRIVCGGPATTPDACYYTDDHYASFRRIVP
ncbi:MAG: ribonuclease [Rhodoferax sp.]